MKYKISENYTVRNILDESIIVQVKGSGDGQNSLYNLNPTAKIVIDSIVAGKGIDEIADAICEIYEITPETAKADAEKLINDFINLGVIIEE